MDIKEITHKKKRLKDFILLGALIARYKKIYLIILGVISSFEGALIIRSLFVYNFAKWHHVVYFGSYWALLLGSLAVILVLLKSKSNYVYSLTLHIYSALIVIWSVMISLLDMRGGDSPFVYFTVIIAIGGLVVLNPIYFTILTIISVASIIIFQFIYKFSWFNSSGEYINIAVFIIMAILMNFRLHKVSMNEQRIEKSLNNLARSDLLTGLYNETAYFETTDEIDSEIKEGKARFAIMVMDVNGVKITNDTYGHRFGANLIKTTGHTLPLIFPNSKLFHIGGDEFVGIILGDDLKNLPTLLEKYEEELSYKEIEFEGEKIKLSVAYGYQIYTNENKYSEVFQKADNNMYINKKMVKEKYNIPSR